MSEGVGVGDGVSEGVGVGDAVSEGVGVGSSAKTGRTGVVIPTIRAITAITASKSPLRDEFFPNDVRIYLSSNTCKNNLIFNKQRIY